MQKIIAVNWHVNCIGFAMRMLCHLLCLGLNLAYGTCVAAAPATAVSLKTSEQSLSVSTRLLAIARPSAHPSGFGFITGKPMQIDYELHMIRFVDRYWPAKMGYEPPRRISTLCLCGPARLNPVSTQSCQTA